MVGWISLRNDRSVHLLRYTDKAKLSKSSMPKPATNGPTMACQRGGPTCAGGNPLRNLAMSPPNSLGGLAGASAASLSCSKGMTLHREMAARGGF